MRFYLIILAFLFLPTARSLGQNGSSVSGERSRVSAGDIPHLEKHGTATRLVVGGKPLLLLAGELHNSTCGGFESMRPVWKRLARKNLNAVIATVSWELIEPVEGEFDFALVDSAIAGAREAHLTLVLIWFGTWKNAGSVYIPSWVKENSAKYPRAEDEFGKPLEILSAFGDASCDADARAFGALMRHLREVDGKKHTVAMIQVENEAGVLDHQGKTPGNARRDFSPPAEAAYKGNVPQPLMDYLLKHKDGLFPELCAAWGAHGFRTSGAWEEVFGRSEFRPEPENWQFYSYYTEELFSAWNYAEYIGKVAAAGKKEYPLPMYANAWLKQPYSYWPGRYPSGGPLPQVLDVWRAAAPSIDFVAPDIYMDQFRWVCQEYTRSDNPLFIPETRGGELGAARALYAFGEFDAGCFSPFGIDGERHEENDPLDESYSVLQSLSPLILANQGIGTMKGLLVDTQSPVQRVELGEYFIEARLAEPNSPAVAGGLIIQTGPQEFIAAGKGLDVYFVPKRDSVRIGINAADEGTFREGKWVWERRLNGDEVHASTFDGTGLKFRVERCTIQKVTLYSYR
jgi:beta-galactosidase GanA